MCGIAGAVGAIDDTVRAAVEAMSCTQAHRGPDDAGGWASCQSDGHGAVLAHRRLAIIDLSEAGHQPMVDAPTGNVVVFNGEIYNFRELRREIGSSCGAFRSHTDTEVILKAYARWGIGFLDRLRGMFTIALWDSAKRECLIARDRLGIKPVYLANVARPRGRPVLLFASEVRAILASGLLPRSVDPIGLASYVSNGFVIGPNTMVRDVHLLPAASYVVASAGEPTPARRYWSLGKAREAVTDRRDLREVLAEAIRMHLVSDVPLGVFLSGGVDSSAVAALAVHSGAAAIRTFNVAFDESDYDESGHARAVARALGTEHQELRLTKDTFKAGLSAALGSLDQPTFDGINTYFVSRAVREAGLTVALAGTGGDELFGGYRTFRDVPWASAWARRVRWVPAGLKAAMVREGLRRRASRTSIEPQTRWGKLGDVLAASGDLLATYQISASLFTSAFRHELAPRVAHGLLDAGMPSPMADVLRADLVGRTTLSSIALLEQSLFLGERLLRDTDSASMASSLEVRVPLLDHEVVEAADALDDAARFSPLGQKRILRDAALGDLDPSLFDRPKSGFVLPIDAWARDSVKEEMDDAFNDDRFCQAAGLEPRVVRDLWNAFVSRAPGVYWSRVWALYVLGRWCNEHSVSVA